MEKKNERLEKQMNFALEIDKAKNIFRQTHLSDKGRKENDAEHSWHMAIMAYVLKEYSNEEIDILKVILMCLIHDIVEILAGDTYAYDEENIKTQEKRENSAKEEIFSLLPENQRNEFISLFDEFNEGKTAEAKFAKTMDNLQPVMLNDSNDGMDWIEHAIHKDQVLQRQAISQEGSTILYDYTMHILDENTKQGNLIS
ncbi:MAG: HD domain-containing protein [Clostridiaceae bacterium]|nr:HD domain-containing protein [Clostridiaceae bacterium]